MQFSYILPRIMNWKLREEQGVEFGFGGAIEIFKAGFNGEAELVKAVVVAVGQRALFGQLPKPLDEAEIGAVGGQEEQFDVEGRRVKGCLWKPRCLKNQPLKMKELHESLC
jgi:hypothetical protein